MRVRGQSEHIVLHNLYISEGRRAIPVKQHLSSMVSSKQFHESAHSRLNYWAWLSGAGLIQYVAVMFTVYVSHELVLLSGTRTQRVRRQSMSDTQSCTRDKPWAALGLRSLQAAQPIVYRPCSRRALHRVCLREVQNMQHCEQSGVLALPIHRCELELRLDARRAMCGLCACGEELPLPAAGMHRLRCC